MPRFNQRGPDGQGAMTGRRIGRCTQFGTNEKAMNADLPAKTDDLPTEPQTPATRGMGLGRGRGFRCRNQRFSNW